MFSKLKGFIFSNFICFLVEIYTYFPPFLPKPLPVAGLLSFLLKNFIIMRSADDEIASLRSERERQVSEQQDEALLRMLLGNMVAMNRDMQRLQQRQATLCSAVQDLALRQSSQRSSSLEKQQRSDKEASKTTTTTHDETKCIDTPKRAPSAPSTPLPPTMGSIASILATKTVIADSDKHYLQHLPSTASSLSPRAGTPHG